MNHKIENYSYILLPSILFRGILHQKYSVDIRLSYKSSLDDNTDKSFAYTNRTYFYLTLAILSE